MFEALFGTEMPLALRFFVAFLVVLALIGAAAYLVRRFGVDRLGAAPPRGRQPRLAVIDAANVDARRRLVLIRRDNIEHLLLIGGPTDIVVEPNIVRAQPAASTRDAVPARMPAEALPRPIPAEAVTWPAEPAPARAARPTPPDEAIHWPVQPEPMPRADAPMRPEHPQEATARFEPPPPRPEPVAKPEVRRPPPTDALAGLTGEFPRAEKRPEPPVAKPRPVPASEQPARGLQPAAAPAPADQNLAEMAQRLEAALRRPIPAREQRNSDATRGPAVEPKARPGAEDALAGPVERAAAVEPKNGHAAPAKESKDTKDAKAAKEPKDAPAETKPAAKEQEPLAMPAGVFDNLEQEMASLLGRSAGKS
ncbi:MAG TPA: flagellar biosynthesis protein FliO [Xanthobacteraceae bacterium]|jgi:hypothetical protein|nr:flagellar biosynthesis protein FliO [Xanthobacteraceae bacterium]